MASRTLDIDYEDIEDEDNPGRKRPGVVATCPDCGAQTKSFGQEAKSIRRCMVLMRDACECDDAQDVYFTCDEL